MYLGYELSQGQRTLGPQRKQAVLQIPIPQTKQEVRAFLGITGFCRIWIPNFALTAKPLYQVLRGPEKEPLLWQEEQTQAMRQLQQALTTAPALGLPDISKPFSLYVDVRQNVALGVLTQKQGSWNRPVAYLSKLLDISSQGWPQCLKILAAVMLLLQEANKLTFSAPVTVYTSHALQTIIDNKGHLWISNQRMHKIQALLLENPQVTLQQCPTLNPATLMPIPDSTRRVHNCMQTIELQYSCRPDLTDQPLHNPDFQWFTDGSSFMDKGFRYPGYATVSQTSTVESAQLPSQASAQFAELYALTRALEIAAGMTLNVYTDSKYAFLTIHAHAAIYKERGYLDSTGKAIQYATLIKRLIKAALLPSKVAIIHCPGHQKDSSLITQGNRKADKEAKRAALEGPPLQSDVTRFMYLDTYLEQLDPTYTREETQKLQQDVQAKLVKGWFTLTDGRIAVPLALARQLIFQAHKQHHLGKTALLQQLERFFYIPFASSLTAQVCSQCTICAQTNARQGPVIPPGRQPIAYFPMDYVVVDFTDMPRSKKYVSLLVIIDTYSGWIEAFPTVNKKAIQVARIFLKEIIPRFGCPSRISSDNGPEFVHQINQALAQALGIKWRFHCAFRPQSAAKVERAHRTIKTLITKFCLETHLHWPDVLPMVLYAIRLAPRTKLQLSPYELMFGRPPCLFKPDSQGWPDLAHKGGVDQQKLLHQLQLHNLAVSNLRHYMMEQQPPPVVTATHGFKPGDRVWVKHWKSDPLSPRWKGPYTVVMCSPLAVKTLEGKSWIHWSRVKAAAPADPVTYKVDKTDKPLVLKFTRNTATGSQHTV